MKTALLSLVVVIAHVSFGQTWNSDQEETVTSFNSKIIDYTIYQNNPVILIQKNREKFIYFVDLNGAKLFESVELENPERFEKDCLGNLFLVGDDSVLQLEIADHLTIEETYSLGVYDQTIRTCEAYLSENIVRGYVGNVLVFEPINDSIFEYTPVIARIEIVPDDYVEHTDLLRSAKSTSDRRTQQTLRRPIENSGETEIYQIESIPQPTTDVHKSYEKSAYALSVFKKSDSLWVVNHDFSELLFYNGNGELISKTAIGDDLSNIEFYQDFVTEKVYARLNNGMSTQFFELTKEGSLIEVGSLRTGLQRSKLMIDNSTLYFLDSSGMGDSIKRIKID